MHNTRTSGDKGTLVNGNAHKKQQSQKKEQARVSNLKWGRRMNHTEE